MKPIVHLTSGIALGGLMYGITHNWGTSVWGSIAAFASDIDHVCEYGVYCTLNRKLPRLSVFFSGKYFKEKGTIFLLLHGWEYEILLLLAWMLSLLNELPSAIILGSLFLGYGLHLVLDSIGNDIGFLGYFLYYRWHFRFSEEILCHGI